MRRSGYAVLLAAAALLGWTAQARAQAEHYANRPWELNLHGGAHFLDDAEDTDVGFGARMFLNQPSGWGFGGNFDWVLSDTNIGDDELNVNTFLYSGEVEYTFPSTSQAHFFVGAGIGAATTTFDDAPAGVDDETDLLVPVGGGLKWFNRTNDPNWAIRVDVRDNIVFAEDAAGDSDAQNNIEVSGGVSFLFGGE